MTTYVKPFIYLFIFHLDVNLFSPLLLIFQDNICFCWLKFTFFFNLLTDWFVPYFRNVIPIHHFTSCCWMWVKLTVSYLAWWLLNVKNEFELGFITLILIFFLMLLFFSSFLFPHCFFLNCFPSPSFSSSFCIFFLSPSNSILYYCCVAALLNRE